MLSTIIVDSAVDLPTAELANVAAAAVLRLPFRFRVAGLFKQRVAIRGRDLLLVARNTLAVPDKEAEESPEFHGRLFQSFASDLLVVVPTPKVSVEHIGLIRNLREEDGYAGAPRLFGGHYQDALDAINRLVVAYVLATKEFFGGRPLRAFGFEEFFRALRWELTLVMPDPSSMADDALVELLDIKAEREWRMGDQLSGNYFDLPVSAYSDIEWYLADQDIHLHHELAVEARAKMIGGDHVGGLLLAVASLESVHAAFVLGRLTDILPADRRPAPLTETFLRELGLTNALELTSQLFLPDTRRPNETLLARAIKGVTYRNEIMHALRSKSGQYHSRNRLASDLTDATVALLDLVAHFVQLMRDTHSQRNSPEPDA